MAGIGKAKRAGARSERSRVVVGQRLGIVLVAIFVISAVIGAGSIAAGAEPSGQIGEAWGAPGSGPGEFFEPAMLGVDSDDGSVYAGDITLDRESYRIQKLSSVGVFQASATVPRFSDPPTNEKIVAMHGIAVDPALHRFYLLEGGKVGGKFVAKRVRVFSTSPDGVALVPVEGTPTLSLPEGAEVLYKPQTIAVDPDNGDLVILAEDSAEHTVIQRIGSAGALGARFVDTTDILKPESGSQKATSIAIGPDGTTYTLTGKANARGADSTRAWQLPPNLTSVAPVPGFVTAAEAEDWPSGLMSRSTGTLFAGGPQIAISADGGTLYWKENLALSTPSSPGEVLVRGYSFADDATDVLYGGGQERCAITTSAAGIATTADKLVVFDYGPEEEEPSYGAKVLTFGPGGSGCPTPVAAFTANGIPDPQVTVQKGDSVGFDASEAAGSELLGASPSQLVWKFGDGSEETVTGSSEGEEVIGPAESTTHRYLGLNTYTVQLEVTLENSPFGSPAPATKTIQVVPGKPTAAFSPSTTNPAAGASVKFDAGASIDPTGGLCSAEAGCSPTHALKTYRWDFGDGSKEETSQVTVEHTFSNPGEVPIKRTVTLIVTSKDGAESASSPAGVITVQGIPGEKPPEGGGGSGSGTTPPSVVLPAPGGGATTKPTKPSGLVAKRRKALARCKKLRGSAKTKCVRKANAIGKPKHRMPIRRGRR